jgi:Asp-tRNA(Asn)/Glu-tRNA(Gln) amidotransferase C subunit
MATQIEKLDVLEFCDEQDMFTQLNEILGSVESVEDFFGIEFPFEDGTYHSDGRPESCVDEEDEDIWEMQETSFEKYRSVGEGVIGFPKTFPTKLFLANLSPASGSTLVYCRWVDDVEDDV